jgi:hypothetical protein
MPALTGVLEDGSSGGRHGVCLLKVGTYRFCVLKRLEEQHSQ